jgi:hypothetical protein
MVSYTNLFLIKGLSFWNGVVDWVQGVRRGWASLRAWFHPESGSWFLSPLSLFPLSYRDAYGFRTAEWKYIPSTHTIQWMGEKMEGEEKEKEEQKEIGLYRLGCLSAQTTVGTETKDMDAFLTDLCIETNGTAPPLMTVLQAWSIYDRRWWSAEPEIRVEWIDALAEEHSATPMDKVAIPLVLRGSKKKN